MLVDPYEMPNKLAIYLYTSQYLSINSISINIIQYFNIYHYLSMSISIYIYLCHPISPLVIRIQAAAANGYHCSGPSFLTECRKNPKFKYSNSFQQHSQIISQTFIDYFQTFSIHSLFKWINGYIMIYTLNGIYALNVGIIYEYL